MNVKISELEKITTMLLSKLRESKGDEVELKVDYYWNIWDNELYNPYEAPKDLTLGQLSFDLEELRRQDLDDNAVMEDLRLVSAILRALSSEYPVAF